MIDNELCGHKTPKGPCNMPKGHAGNFHRVRHYAPKVKWSIKTAKAYKIIEQGEGRMEFGYALTRILKRYKNVVVYIGQDEVQ